MSSKQARVVNSNPSLPQTLTLIHLKLIFMQLVGSIVELLCSMSIVFGGAN